MEKKFKIAFCFSGQLREWKAAYPSIKRFINLFDDEPDIFCHVWDFNSTSHAIMFNTGENEKYDLEKGELDEFLQTYKPKKYLIEGREKSELISVRAYETIKLVHKLNQGEDIMDSPYWLAPQYYGISRVSMLKQEYELENNFTYDVVFRIRYDSFFSDEFFTMFLTDNGKITYLKPFTIYATHVKISDRYPFNLIGDVFFMSDSLSFNILADYVNHLPQVFKCMPHKKPTPEELFAFYIKSNFFKIRALEGDVKVKRPQEYFEKLESVGVKYYGCDV